MAGSAEILTEIKDMRKEFDTRMRIVETNTALTQQTVQGLSQDMKLINEVVIIGEKDPPLKQQVKDLRDDITELKCGEKEKRGFWRDFGSKVLQTGIGAIIGIVMAKLGIN